MPWCVAGIRLRLGEYSLLLFNILLELSAATIRKGKNKIYTYLKRRKQNYFRYDCKSNMNLKINKSLG